MVYKKISTRDNKFEEDYEEISFPKSEYASLQKRLDSENPIYSTRTREEKSAYSSGQLLNSPFGTLKVVEVKTFRSIKDHPFEKDLTDEQRERIKGKSFDIIKLVLATDV